MIIKETVLKTVAMIAALVMILSLCSCGKRDIEPDVTDPQPSKDDNVPDNVVPPITQAMPDITALPDVTDAPETSADDNTGEPESGDDNPDNKPDSQPEPNENVDNALRAMEYLRLFNSNKVHIKFIEVTSYDGENIFSVGREAFIDGNDMIFINDSVKTLYRNGIVTDIYYDDGAYCSYAIDGGFGPLFGYPSDYYTHLSTEQTDGGYSEIYSISGRGLTSTWTFDNNGKLLRVADRSLDEGYFMLYTFETIDSDISGMDFTIPDGFIETEPDDFYY